MWIESEKGLIEQNANLDNLEPEFLSACNVLILKLYDTSRRSLFGISRDATQVYLPSEGILLWMITNFSKSINFCDPELLHYSYKCA